MIVLGQAQPLPMLVRQFLITFQPVLPYFLAICSPSKQKLNNQLQSQSFESSPHNLNVE